MIKSNRTRHRIHKKFRSNEHCQEMRKKIDRDGVCSISRRNKSNGEGVGHQSRNVWRLLGLYVRACAVDEDMIKDRERWGGEILVAKPICVR